ncbi:MAG: hypothetical protein JW995_14755 [Melioribacteraceae bacterium]|nr:hypothetical protein [Melioribacteraceae bacterium]
MRCYYKRFTAVLIIFILTSCSGDKAQRDYVTVGVQSDVETFNPLFAFQSLEGSISELLFLSLLRHEWNEKLGKLESYPMMAESLKWNEDGSSIFIKLREDIYWSDSVKCTIDDVMFSLAAYSDPDIKSRGVGAFHNYVTDESGRIDAQNSFDRISDYELVINFKKGAAASYFDLDYPVIPKHIFGTLNTSQILSSEYNFEPVTNGAFKLLSWQKDQSIILGKNEKSFLNSDSTINRIIFKVVPDYNNRLLQLKKGEIDFLEDIKPEDAAGIEEFDNINVEKVSGRQYDYIGWNLIDPEVYRNTGKMIPNKFFGSKKVRQAITHALNRREVIDNFLLNYGELAVGPISSIFKSVYDTTLKPLEYNIELAKQLLKEEGWIDVNGDGIIEKNGLEFRFDLKIATGLPRREYAANIFNNNLKQIGIDANIEFMELNSFLDGLFMRKYNAWLIGWVIPIPVDLRIQWYSDFERTPLNLSSYRNREVDSLLDRLEMKLTEQERNQIFKNLNYILHDEQPFTFLYWVDNIVAYNTRINNIYINPLGSIHYCWEWTLK